MAQSQLTELSPNLYLVRATAADPITRLNAALEGRYQIERRLGEGGMETAYLTGHLWHSRNVTLKVLNGELAATCVADDVFLRVLCTLYSGGVGGDDLRLPQAKAS